jgi:predicted nucleotide-binding protein
LAALSLAAKIGISPGKYASAQELGEVRNVARVFVPPSTAPTRSNKKKSKSKAAKLAKEDTVWVVHGRNLKARSALVGVLKALGMKVLDFQAAIRKTKQGAPYVGAILTTAFNVANFVVVLLTPDDAVKLQKPFRTMKDPDYETRLMGQPRPNVLFEAGQAFGLRPDKTILVQVGEMKPLPSDVLGRHVCLLTNDSKSREDLVEKLRGIGAPADTSSPSYLKFYDALAW